jgi:hypothetical protein
MIITRLAECGHSQRNNLAANALPPRGEHRWHGQLQRLRAGAVQASCKACTPWTEFTDALEDVRQELSRQVHAVRRVLAVLAYLGS